MSLFKRFVLAQRSFRLQKFGRPGLALLSIRGWNLLVKFSLFRGASFVWVTKSVDWRKCQSLHCSVLCVSCHGHLSHSVLAWVSGWHCRIDNIGSRRQLSCRKMHERILWVHTQRLLSKAVHTSLCFHNYIQQVLSQTRNLTTTTKITQSAAV